MSQATLGTTAYRNSDLFSGYYLDERVDDLDAWNCDEEAQAALEELQRLWELEGELVASYKEDELLDSWIDEVLDVLGFGTLSETTLPDSEGYNDRLLFESDEKRRDASIRKRDGDRDAMYSLASAVLEAKQWDADFTKRFAEMRSYRDASHQIKYYLEHTPERLEWGILTDGKTWRLYGTKDYATETYYEVNLPELLESGDLEQFKYFYAFFRPAAFRETAGTTFLETVWNESETAAQELGEDLQDNVFTALRILGEGFVETNDLDIDPDDEDAREELKEQSLVLLYRLMFVLYAESRHLISPDEPSREAEFNENFSLDELRQEIHEDIDAGDSFDEYSEYSTSMWGRLQDLFRLIDSGEESLGIPPYNGGLFDDDEHAFLANNEVADRYIAEVVYRLGTTTADDGDGYVLADYADLDTRHLGTIYEGLLEHEFRIAPEQYAAVSEDGGQVWKPATEVSVADAVETVEEGELYVVNDDGERKATGAYYTPDYVVAYIVEETIDPLVAEIKDDIREEEGLEPGDKGYIAPFLEQIRELTVLDPAMGSGHFLTKATGYLTEQVMEVIRHQEIQSYDEQDIRRIIARECIYGVDINGMAVELAKLSMWLETLATDQPLAFLDHHLKDGNSLVGSDITEVLSDDSAKEGGQLTLTQVFAKARRDTLEHVMELMSELLAIDNETLADIKSMEETYDEIRSDPLYGRLFELANVHTAEQFGLDVPEGVYEEMAGAIEDESEWADVQGEDWFASAQTMADEEDFFHWELEYPEVFFGTDGEKRADGGFDAVVGNPPYVKIQNIRKTNAQFADFASSNYMSATGRFDLYALFAEKGSQLSAHGGLGYILPNKFFESNAGEGLRKYLTRETDLNSIVDFGENQVFSGATTYTCLLLLSGDSYATDEFDYCEVPSEAVESADLSDISSSKVSTSELDSTPWILTGAIERQTLNKMEERGPTLGDVTDYLAEGIVSGDNEVLFVDVVEWREDEVVIESPANNDRYTLERELVQPLTDGNQISRYLSIDPQTAVIYPYSNHAGNTSEIPESTLESDYPRTYQYLNEFRKRLSERGSDSMNYPTWYSLWCPREKEVFDSNKILVPDVCQRSEFTLDDQGIYIRDTAYAVVPEENDRSNRLVLTAILNSSPTWFYIYHTSPVLRGDFRRFKTSYLGPIPLPDMDNGVSEEMLHKMTPPADCPREALMRLSDEMIENTRKIGDLNLSFKDYLGNYDDGDAIGDVGLIQPPKNAADSILQETSEEKINLRTEGAIVDRLSPTTVEIRLTARYKPDDEDEHDTDQWGYTKTDPLPALRITDLTESEADLIEAFVPVAVDEAGGFAGFRETATKTNSLVDRLHGLTLPAVDDVRDGLESYLETKERAEELEEQIERTDELIDEIVYELYGLSDEEIEIVEEAVGE
ncbi:Eco57I restriction-modification methylase domain-containing protein [Halobaculum magnesiiphilum]|uniref:site-specific DNA-methyltransferase (adenine-specific) n=1 Tax=Halobaculum magnesiiphilum TaxID=1017351 RepID=A0A8T8WHG4_9EURY|nr:N-6 DNA methylase [Halobaculum magnesiiphilum]QZP39193.1 Eco57I restriction-modification methylase domain-containing protein [Halobaculum magnesiiphilum]